MCPELVKYAPLKLQAFATTRVVRVCCLFQGYRGGIQSASSQISFDGDIDQTVRLNHVSRVLRIEYIRVVEYVRVGSVAL